MTCAVQKNTDENILISHSLFFFFSISTYNFIYLLSSTLSSDAGAPNISPINTYISI